MEYKERRFKRINKSIIKSKRQKRTIKFFDNFLQINITCAGMPKSCYKYVDWNNFKVGLTVPGKLTFKHVKGGVILVDTDFTIKEEKVIKAIEKF